MLNPNNITHRIWIGLKKGYKTLTFPAHILELNALIYLIILIFLGGISFLILLGNSYINNPIYILNLAMFFAIIFTFYHYFLTYYKIKHIITVLKSDELKNTNQLTQPAFLLYFNKYQFLSLYS